MDGRTVQLFPGAVVAHNAATFLTQFKLAFMSSIVRTVEIPALWLEDPRTPGQEHPKSTIGNQFAFPRNFVPGPSHGYRVVPCIPLHTQYSFSIQGSVWPRAS